ncbi:MAG: peptidase, partial [Achromobacter sp.]|nr:peptidase [Achromobacter sp.]
MRLNLAIAARLRRHVLTGAAALALVMPLAACERAPAPVAAEPASNAAPAGQPGPTATAPGFP